MSLGPFLFAAPWALAALAALPLLWWLIRATPPAPQREAFPPTRLLVGLKTEEQTRQRAPWWLVLFRALTAALMIIGFARPSLAPSAADLASGGRTLIVIDNGWTSAPFWPQLRSAAAAAASQAERANAPVFLLLTAPEKPARDAGEALTAADARARIARLEPKPWRPDRADAAQRLSRTSGRFSRIVWISDGLNDAGARALADALAARGPVTARLPALPARAVVGAAVSPSGVEVTVRRAANGGAEAAVAAETLEGRALGAAELRFRGDDLTASARITLPPEIAARAARVRIVGEQSAGGVRLLPSASGRPFVGLVDPGGEGQTLLSELYYAERALAPYASLQHGAVRELINAHAQALLLPDAAPLSPLDRSALNNWLQGGGLLIRFAGPRLANEADNLLPVRLRPGSRSLGGALAWEHPLGFAPFPDDSPFAGLSAPNDVVIRQQVLAEPASAEQARVWARLEDNSPLVTAGAKGRGLIVLYHVSAGPTWSDLPLSGLFVDMLRRTIAFAGRADGAGERTTGGGPYTATRLLDGFGALAAASPDAQPIPAEAFATARAGPATPPGLYERSGITSAVDAAQPTEDLSPLQLPRSVGRSGLGAAVEHPLAGLFFGLAALMLCIDLLIALFLVGRLPRFAGAGAAALLLMLAPDARAQSSRDLDPTLTIRLAYVRTGDARVDRTSQAGLAALSDMLSERTSVEPGPPVGVDLDRDNLSAYPFLYFPAPSSPHRLSDTALANLDRYLAVGGLLLVDTRDAGSAQRTRPAAVMLSGLDAPPLEAVTSDHVVARAFYLLRSFPGRTQSTHLWAETASSAASRDGVAALFVGDGDWASAWSGDAPLDGGVRQREIALRFGVNLVMVALTGNYKADQVHLPALLERLGRR
ncbi:MAG TPA: DUF4159 domain-containing protein [Caulobacterales bacterium]|nr:DUF4159 domain-containing protein [Caulobacterales bacterium]